MTSPQLYTVIQATLVNFSVPLEHWTTLNLPPHVIEARTPFCTGDHYPLQPHHFGHLQAVAPPLQPRQHFPVHVSTCLPCNAPLPAAARGQATPLHPTMNPNAGLAAGRASD